MPLAEVRFAAYQNSGYDRDLESEVILKIRHFEQDGVHQGIV
jgi:hypothetical protein